MSLYILAQVSPIYTYITYYTAIYLELLLHIRYHHMIYYGLLILACRAFDQARERTPSTLAARPSLLDREAMRHFPPPSCGETCFFSLRFSRRILHKIAIETILVDMTPFGLAELGSGLLKRQSGFQISRRRGDTCFGQIFRHQCSPGS